MFTLQENVNNILSIRAFLRTLYVCNLQSSEVSKFGSNRRTLKPEGIFSIEKIDTLRIQ